MIRRLVFLAVLAVASAALLAGLQLGRSLLETWEDARRGGAGSLLGREQRRIAYHLDTEQWTEFPSPPAGHTLRLVSHGDLPPSFARAGGRGAYDLQVRFLDRGGSVLAERRIHIESPVRFYRPRGGGERRLLRFYQDRDALPTETRESLVLVPGSQPWSMQVRAGDVSPEMRDVHLRVYAREIVNPGRLDYLWQRLTQAERTQLAADLVFPAELLKISEQRNLVRNRWRPLGPRGVEGRDFRLTVFYTLENSELVAERDIPASPGLYADRGVRAAFRLPAGTDAVGIRAVPLVADPAQSSARTVRGLLRAWQDGRLLPVLQPLDSAGRGRVSGASLVEVLSDRPVRVQVDLRQPGPETVPAPDFRPVTLAAYRLHPREPVIYPVHHVAAEPTLLRLDVRAVRPAGTLLPATVPPVQVRLLDANDAVLETMQLQPGLEHSLYDHLPGQPVAMLSEAARYHWRLPADVRRVEVTGGPSLLVAAYNRPAGLARVAGMDAGGDDDAIRSRTWFVLRPGHDGEARRELLALGDRPPRLDRRRDLESRYLWEDFAPRGESLTRGLLEARILDTARRPQTLPVFFVRVPDGVHRLRLDAPGSAGVVRPQLLFRNPARRAQPVRVRVNGRPVFDGRLPPGQGLLPMGSLPVGPHRFEVEAGGVAVYLNHRRVQDEGLLIRSPERMGAGTRRFPVHKMAAAAESFSVRLYRPADAEVNTEGVVRVRLVGAAPAAGGPFDALTLPEHRIHVATGDDRRYPVLGTRKTYTGLEPVYFRLGDDLPAGHYELEIGWPEGARDGLVLVSRLLPGDYDVIRVLRP